MTEVLETDKERNDDRKMEGRGCEQEERREKEILAKGKKKEGVVLKKPRKL